jgi:cytochrome P450
MSTAASDIYYDPYDYAIDADPHPMWRRMRDEAPLYYNAEHDFYALSRFDDVLGASLDVETFSSAHGTVLDLMTDEPHDSPMMIFKDPPEHTRLRKLVARVFSPRRVEDLEAPLRTIAAGYLDAHKGAESFDYVADFGAKLPVMAISSLLGVPEQDRDQIAEWSDMLVHRDADLTLEQAQAHHMHYTGLLAGYFGRYLEERKQTPRDDIMTDLLHAEVTLEDGSRRGLSQEEILAFIGLLSGAGNETVARLLGWAGILLARNPDQRQKLVDDPSLIPNAVEELLRYEAPSPVQGRYVTRDVELHDQTVAKGSRMLLLTGSAGRDDRVYTDPDRFDVTRTIDRHLTFGIGVHFCLGASLARLEARIALEETLLRYPDWDVDWSATEMVHTSTVRGYAKVPIRP